MSQRNVMGEVLIEDLAETLQVPQSRYEAADRSYRSVADWLDRPASVFAGVDLDVYTQGSFRLGTAIRPLSGEEHYDLDVVCEFDLGKWDQTQAQLHADLGKELKLYLTSMIGEARLTDFAEHLGVTQGTRPKVVKRLQREGLVESLPYLSIVLTAHGVEVTAMSHVRHDIVRMRCRGGCPAAKPVMQAKDARSE